jgi:hypothetical protein
MNPSTTRIKADLPRPQAWTNPLTSTPFQFIVLMVGQILLVRAKLDELPGFEQALASGQNMELLLTPRQPVVIPLVGLIRARLDVGRRRLVVTYLDGSTEKVQTVEFVHPGNAEELFAALKDRLVDEYHLKAYNITARQLATLPLIVFVTVAGLVTMLAMRAYWVREWAKEKNIQTVDFMWKFLAKQGAKEPWYRRFDAYLFGITPEVILMVGGVLIALILYWTFARIVYPPTLVYLEKKSD